MSSSAKRDARFTGYCCRCGRAVRNNRNGFCCPECGDTTCVSCSCSCEIKQQQQSPAPPKPDAPAGECKHEELALDENRGMRCIDCDKRITDNAQQREGGEQ